MGILEILNTFREFTSETHPIKMFKLWLMSNFDDLCVVVPALILNFQCTDVSLL